MELLSQASASRVVRETLGSVNIEGVMNTILASVDDADDRVNVELVARLKMAKDGCFDQFDAECAKVASAVQAAYGEWPRLETLLHDIKTNSVPNMLAVLDLEDPTRQNYRAKFRATMTRDPNFRMVFGDNGAALPQTLRVKFETQLAATKKK